MSENTNLVESDSQCFAFREVVEKRENVSHHDSPQMCTVSPLNFTSLLQSTGPICEVQTMSMVGIDLGVVSEADLGLTEGEGYWGVLTPQGGGVSGGPPPEKF